MIPPFGPGIGDVTLTDVSVAHVALKLGFDADHRFNVPLRTAARAIEGTAIEPVDRRIELHIGIISEQFTFLSERHRSKE
jgi:hypothetical protein